MNKPSATVTPIVWAHCYPGTITAYFNGHCCFCSQLPDRDSRFDYWRAYMEREGFKVKVIHKS